MFIDPRRLPVLLSVHREGGIIAAADVLHISPSAVSQQIQRLEAEVGLELIERSPSGATLTPAGRILIAGAERIEAELSETAQALQPLTGQVTGTVTIGAFQTVLRAVLLPFSETLAHALPGVEPHFLEGDETPAMAALRSGGLDMLIIERDSDPGKAPRGYTDIPLIDEPWFLVTAESAPPIASERDLTQFQWLRVAPGSAGAHAMERINTGMAPLNFTAHTYTNYEAAHALVRGGFGATVLPSMAIEGMHMEGIRATPLPGLGVRRILIRHRNSLTTSSPAAAQLIEHLLRWVAEHAPQWNQVLTHD